MKILAYKRIFLISILVLFLLPVLYSTSKVFLYKSPPPHLSYANRQAKSQAQYNNFKSAAFCGQCHEEIYQQWQESWLSRAYHSSKIEIDLHQLTLKLRGMDPQEARFCLECHAPLALTSPEDISVNQALAQEGVSCLVCHAATHIVPDSNPASFAMEPFLGMRGPFRDAVSPFHKTTYDTFFTDKHTDLCATCHFSIWPQTKVPIDWTYEEYLVGRESSDSTCKDCHMPLYVGQAAQIESVPKRNIRSHTFKGGHDSAFVASSVDMKASVIKESQERYLSITLTNKTGHNLPTGNGPAPQLRLSIFYGDSAKYKLITERVYRTDYLLANGKSTYDATIATKIGKDNTLKPYEIRTEKIMVPKKLYGKSQNEKQSGSFKITLSFSYWYPYEKSARLSSYITTLTNHYFHRENNLINLLKTFTDKQTYKVLKDIRNLERTKPIPIKTIYLPSNSVQL